MEAPATDLRYPIGKYNPVVYSEQQRVEWLNDIKSLPSDLENSVLNLDASQLATPYREGGWTVQQVVHHVADSHINAYCRFKLGSTETNPTIRTYEEKLWAELNDVKVIPLNVSITLLHALHIRWVAMMNAFDINDWSKTVFHPEHNKTLSLWFLLGMYSWHGKHHTAHITSLRERNHWN